MSIMSTLMNDLDHLDWRHFISVVIDNFSFNALNNDAEVVDERPPVRASSMNDLNKDEHNTSSSSCSSLSSLSSFTATSLSSLSSSFSPSASSSSSPAPPPPPTPPPPPPQPQPQQEANNDTLWSGLIECVDNCILAPSPPLSPIASDSSFSESILPDESQPVSFSRVIARPVRPILSPSKPSTSRGDTTSVSPTKSPSIAKSRDADPSPNHLKSKRRQSLGSMMCTFCKRNSEPREYYTSHVTRDAQGKVVCPILSKYKCEICGATGPDSHTRSYCPLKDVLGEIFKDTATIQMKLNNFARTARGPE